MKQSGVALKDFLSDNIRSYNIKDVDILEGRRDFSRSDTTANTMGSFSRNTIPQIAVPIVTAPMTDVTDCHIATVAARHGALGILPATFGPDEQADIVRKIKKTEGGFIEHSFSLSPDDSVTKALRAPYSNIPVVESGGRLVGLFILQKYGEYFYENCGDLTLREVMEAGLERIAVSLDYVRTNGEFDYGLARGLMQQRRLPALAVVDNDQKLLCLVTMKDVISKTSRFPHATRDRKGRLCVGAAILEYSTPENLKRVRLLVDAEVDVIVVEQAHAWNVDTANMVKYIKQQYPHIDVVTGNDSVAEAVRYHAGNGVDGVKIGQGPGSICITGDEENVGLWRPQLSAVYDCTEVARQYCIPGVADGGVDSAYAAFKVFAAGASSAMIGRLVAQTKDSPAQEIAPGRKLYRAMGSPELVKTHAAAYKKYDPKTFIAEGRSNVLEVVGTFEEFLQEFSAKLRRIFERFGARDLAELHTKLRSGDIRAQFAHDRSNR